MFLQWSLVKHIGLRPHPKGLGIIKACIFKYPVIFEELEIRASPKESEEERSTAHPVNLDFLFLLESVSKLSMHKGLEAGA